MKNPKKFFYFIEKYKLNKQINQWAKGNNIIQQAVTGYKSKGFILNLKPDVSKLYNLILSTSAITYLSILILGIIWTYINKTFDITPICGFFFGIPFSIFTLIFGILTRNLRNVVLGAVALLVSFIPIIIMRIQLLHYSMY